MCCLSFCSTKKTLASGFLKKTMSCNDVACLLSSWYFVALARGKDSNTSKEETCYDVVSFHYTVTILLRTSKEHPTKPFHTTCVCILSTKNPTYLCHILRVEHLPPAKTNVPTPLWLQRLWGTLVDVFGVIHSVVGGESHPGMSRQTNKKNLSYPVLRDFIDWWSMIMGWSSNKSSIKGTYMYILVHERWWAFFMSPNRKWFAADPLTSKSAIKLPLDSNIWNSPAIRVAIGLFGPKPRFIRIVRIVLTRPYTSLK